VFAGERRVWLTAAACALPLAALLVFYCVRPRPYYTGTNSVETDSYVVPATAGEPVCVPDLQIPAGTGDVRLSVISATRLRPALSMTLHAGGRTIRAALAARRIGADRISDADFRIPLTPSAPATRAASLCVSAAGVVNWGGTPLPAVPVDPPSAGGAPLAARIAVWYLRSPHAQRSYAGQLGAIFARAALFRPGFVGAWTYWLLLFAVAPATALLAVRCLALAVAERARRVAAWLFAIAAVNALCWALITPAFQAPDEVDHFAYVQSLVQRGVGPSHEPTSPLPRWSSAEALALEGTDFSTDHQVGDSRVPWLAGQQRAYFRQAAAQKPSTADGGGYTTSAVHGPIYYLALAPAYLLTRGGSVFSQLTLMRASSALIGALVAVFTFLLARELAPQRQWLGVVAALLVAYQPMYSFISGIVNNDVGVNAAAAALELLLIRLLRRGITIPWGLLTGVVLIALPIVKGTGESLYPVAALVLLAALWRDHSRRALLGWAALALGALAMGEVSAHVLSAVQPSSASTGAGLIGTNANATSEALHHIPDYLSYLWQALLPRLPFMTPHFPSMHPYFVIFVERGWGAFGWYDVLFPHWVYVLIFAAMILAFPLAGWAARREWRWLRAHWMEALALVSMPVAVIAGFEAAYYTPGMRPAIAEFGRYAFPAIGPLAVLFVGALHAFGRRRVVYVGTAAAVATIALSYASQLLTLTSFYV
jgi:Predicted membrane protein (DUF2142)